ncbi:MAG: hypothetical protein HQ485_14340 [Acidobacteria bacterium]|jgi:Tfp pilus assembly protein PilN|nr:hypothetical protein [Acidobacteriota bacterium]
MMLRGNLATRPFYNERLVMFLLAVVAAVVLALTFFNATRLMQLSGRRSELRTQMSHDESGAAQVLANAAAVQNSVDRTALASLAWSAREANTLIDQRTFSWTTFFGYIEATIPQGVRLTAVSPEIDKGNIVVTMLLIGRQADDVADFMTALEETGAFYDALPTVADQTDEGLERVTVRVGYLPPVMPAPAPPAPATGGGQ